MASDEMLSITAQQPSEGDQLNPFTMEDLEIMDLISATHIVPPDEHFNAEPLFVVVKNILRRSTQIVDNVLLGREPLENLEEKMSRASLDPLLCTLKQLSSEMTCKAPGVETAHKTTISILNKLSTYSWDAKAVLTLAAFALDYEDFLALAKPHSSHQLVESAEIGELNKIIIDMLDIIDSILCASDLLVGVYWIIITVVACTTHMYCLKSNKDKTQELLPFAKKISETHARLSMRIMLPNFRIAETKGDRKLKELLQTPDEITKVLKALIFAKDDKQPLIDGSTSEMVSIDVLKKNGVLLLISGLDISRDDISVLKSIYDGIREEGYDYKIVWIPIVEQWTDDLQKKFEMLRSRMPWYIVQYFSPLAATSIKFIKEEWYFENKPIVVVMNLQGDVVNKNAFPLIREGGMSTFLVITQAIMARLHTHPPGPYAIEEYTFFCGGKDNRWIEQFSKQVNVLAEDPITEKAYIFIELSCLGKGPIQQRFWKLCGYETQKKTVDPVNEEIQKLLNSFKHENRWAVLTKWSTRVVSDHGPTILKVLEAFEEWKVNVPEKGFEICFKEYHDKFLQTGPMPSTA
ncbi:protein SIEVE ELEMENT OCCLUSION B-like [Corylus avellana]|uniref:protein SIEVE ELEMENT OCCLUSION B-like n=1 Tax=Corylus avellana TaxID=13451 RepID=UPI00286BC336|nr:protein SIEVE ELEMENT OCCLUSION B-like [Corylus avellana]